MTKDILSGLTQSRTFTLAEARMLLDDPPAQMTDKMKRRLASFVTRYEQQGRRIMHERYAAALDQMDESRTQIDERIGAAHREVADIDRKVRTGKVTAADAQKQLTLIFRQIRQDRESLDALDMSAERAVAIIQTDPADYQAENLERFPVLAGRLPVVSVAWLSGEDTADPLGEA